MSTGIIEVFGSGNTVHQVNLGNYSCSCQDWRVRRRDFAASNPKRLCKHLIKVIVENGLVGEFPGVPLEELASQKKGFPLPKPVSLLVGAAQQSFGCELTEEQQERLTFIMGGRLGIGFDCWEWIKEKTQNGKALVFVPPVGKFRVGFERLVWIGAASVSDDVHPDVLLDAFDLATLKKIGQTMGTEKFGQRKKGIRMIMEHPDFAQLLAGFDPMPTDFFHIDKIGIDTLG